MEAERVFRDPRARTLLYPLGRKVSFLVHSSGYEPGTLAVWKHALVSTAHELLYKFFQAGV